MYHAVLMRHDVRVLLDSTSHLTVHAAMMHVDAASLAATDLFQPMREGHMIA